MSLYPLIKFFHLFAAVIWAGGMFFAYVILRPAASALTPPERLALWVRCFDRFFPAVWGSIAVLLLAGFWMLHQLGGLAALPTAFRIKVGLAIVMMMIFGHVVFAPFRRLRKAVAAADWPNAAWNLTQIRWIVLFNLLLAIIVIFLAVVRPGV